MDRLEAMTILLAAVDQGSLSAASRHLGIPLATVSRRVSELEEHLKVRLLLRGHRRIELTDAGRGYVAACRRIAEDIADADRAAAGEYRAPQGELVISEPFIMGRSFVTPVVVEFLEAYPDIRVDVQLTDRVVNLVQEHVDLALRVGELPDSSLTATRVGLIRQMVCASPAYLKRRGTPKKPADLAKHDCIANRFFAFGEDWPFHIDGKLKPMPVPARLSVNSSDAALVASVAGAGIAQILSCHIADLLKSRALVGLLEAYEPPPIPVSLIYPSQRQEPLKLRAFLDFAVPRLRKSLGYVS
ncbi:MAG TPA: LysR family transcriptional regulator [Rhizomicrobium sp.]|jgi:DNA-binding transcriptional LysR family regulator|nr:LysR family transcriptional regulator [Rhizomicrobium sp.]